MAVPSLQPTGTAKAWHDAFQERYLAVSKEVFSARLCKKIQGDPGCIGEFCQKNQKMAK
ncbi:MAG: hypothetical protein ACRDD3_07520 [Azovibrio sp.]